MLTLAGSRQGGLLHAVLDRIEASSPPAAALHQIKASSPPPRRRLLDRGLSPTSAPPFDEPRPDALLLSGRIEAWQLLI